MRAALLGRLAQEVSSACGKNVEEDSLAKAGQTGYVALTPWSILRHSKAQPPQETMMHL